MLFRLHPPEAVRATLQRSCYDCHSNATSWPWYAHFRPVAGKIQRDVMDGRKSLNFSEWSTQTRSDPQLQSATLATACSLMEAGMMPPRYYVYLRPARGVSSQDTKAFCRWTRQMSAELRQ